MTWDSHVIDILIIFLIFSPFSSSFPYLLSPSWPAHPHQHTPKAVMDAPCPQSLRHPSPRTGRGLSAPPEAESAPIWTCGGPIPTSNGHACVTRPWPVEHEFVFLWVRRAMLVYRIVAGQVVCGSGVGDGNMVAYNSIVHVLPAGGVRQVEDDAKLLVFNSKVLGERRHVPEKLAGFRRVPRRRALARPETSLPPTVNAFYGAPEKVLMKLQIKVVGGLF